MGQARYQTLKVTLVVPSHCWCFGISWNICWPATFFSVIKGGPSWPFLPGFPHSTPLTSIWLSLTNHCTCTHQHGVECLTIKNTIKILVLQNSIGLFSLPIILHIHHGLAGGLSHVTFSPLTEGEGTLEDLGLTIKCQFRSDTYHFYLYLCSSALCHCDQNTWYKQCIKRIDLFWLTVWKFQSMVIWLLCFEACGEVETSQQKVMVKESCLPCGSWEAKKEGGRGQAGIAISPLQACPNDLPSLNPTL